MAYSDSDRWSLKRGEWLALDWGLRRALRLRHECEPVTPADVAHIARDAARSFIAVPTIGERRTRRWLLVRAWTGDRWGVVIDGDVRLLERL